MDIIQGDGAKDTIKEKVMMALRSKFRPEFLNRIDEFVTFNSLEMGQLVNIVNLELEKVVKRLTEKKLSLSITEGAREWLAERGYDHVYGARPLKRTIQREVETPLAKGILGGDYNNCSGVLIDAKPGDSKLSITGVAGIKSDSSVSQVTDDSNIMQ